MLPRAIVGAAVPGVQPGAAGDDTRGSPSLREPSLIIPLSHSESRVRRLPWVTFALMALCLVSFLGLDTSGADSPAPVSLREAGDYWRERPYLDALPEVVTEVSYDVSPNQRGQYVDLLRQNADPPDDFEVVLEEQSELDTLTQRAVEGPPGAGAGDAFRRWGLVPTDPRPWAFVTTIFVHVGWLHLLGNLFMLFLAGPPLEDRWGRPLYAAFFVVGGAAAAAFWMLLSIDVDLPLIGASGAVAALFGAFMVRFWGSTIRLGYFFIGMGRVLRGTFNAPAGLLLAAWVAGEIWKAWLGDRMGSVGGTAYWAHVGGFLFGVVGAAGLRVLRIEERFIDPAIESRTTLGGGDPAIARALAARTDGDIEGALAMLESRLRGAASDPDALIAYWDTAVAAQRPEQGAAAALELVQRRARGGDAAGAADLLAEVRSRTSAGRLETATALRLVPLLASSDRAELATGLLRGAVDPAAPTPTPAQALRLVEQARELDPPSALAAARIALDPAAELPDARRAALTALVVELEKHGVKAPPAIGARAVPPAAETGDEEAPLELETTGHIEIEPTAHGAGSEASLPGELLPDDAPHELERDAAPTAPTLALDPSALPGEAEPAIDVEALTAEVLELGGIELGDLAQSFCATKVSEIAPLGLDAVGLLLDGAGSHLHWERVQAVAAAAVGGQGARPVAIVDLILNWQDAVDGTLEIVRIRSDRAPLRELFPGADSTTDALRALLERALDASGAVPLPDPDAARGRPFRSYPDLATYEREALRVG